MGRRYVIGFMNIIKWLLVGGTILLSVHVGESEVLFLLLFPGFIEIVTIMLIFDKDFSFQEGGEKKNG